jgi:hypothetical protein
MIIRWYKGGKLDKFQNTSNTEYDISNIEVGSIIDLPKNVLRYDHIDEENPNFDLNLWSISTADKNNKLEVTDKMFIDTEFYTGYIVKVSVRWPWYQLVGAKLSDL